MILHQNQFRRKVIINLIFDSPFLIVCERLHLSVFKIGD